MSGFGENGDRAVRLRELRGRGGDRKGDLDAPMLFRRFMGGRIGLRLAPIGEAGQAREHMDSGLNRPRHSDWSSIDILCSSEKKGSSSKLLALGRLSGTR